MYVQRDLSEQLDLVASDNQVLSKYAVLKCNKVILSVSHPLSNNTLVYLEHVKELHKCKFELL